MKRLLTFSELADLLGERGRDRVRRVRRMMLKHPAAQHFIVRVGSGQRAHHRVALVPLREYLPQLRDPRDETIALVRREVADALHHIEEKLTDTADAVEAVARESGRRIQAIEAQITALRKAS